MSNYQPQNSREALNELLSKGTLLSPNLGWEKTEIVRLFISEQTGNECLILTSLVNMAKWKAALSNVGIDENRFQVEHYDNYRQWVNPLYDLLVFDEASTWKTGTRAKICKQVYAHYVLTFGSVSDEDEEMMQKVWKRRTLELRCSLFSPNRWDYDIWGYVPQSYIPHSFFVRYYPTSLKFFEATEDECKDRRFIEDVNNNSKQAFDKAIELLDERLKETFYDLLPELTLFCIPALISAKNEAIYKVFSERLCITTGMSNAATHYYTVIKDDDDMIGENGIDVEIDWDYFRGRNILLFDVLLSTGEILRHFSELMALHGAKVIACITLGKSCYQREEDEKREAEDNFSFQ